MEDATNMLNVLWVEDNVVLHQSFSMEAKRAPYFLKLIPHSCWEDAEKVLIENYDEITAIILDAKCKFKSGEGGEMLSLYGKDFKELSGFLRNEFDRIFERYGLWYDFGFKWSLSCYKSETSTSKN